MDGRSGGIGEVSELLVLDLVPSLRGLVGRPPLGRRRMLTNDLIVLLNQPGVILRPQILDELSRVPLAAADLPGEQHENESNDTEPAELEPRDEVHT